MRRRSRRGPESVPMPSKPEPPIRIGISSCLLGEKVRFDGGHKLDHFITDTLGRFFEWVPVCPEVEAGFGTPREAMRLEDTVEGVRLRTVKNRVDLTSAMEAFAAARVAKLAEEGLGGYILKSKSPSCGLERVRIYGASNVPAKTGRGLFAEALLARFPDLPVEEEGRLCDLRIRENWVQRVFAFYRLNRLWNSRWTVRSLQNFHAEHKLTLMSHSPQATRTLGNLLARATGVPRQDIRRQYQAEFMKTLSVLATPGKHANVLQHAAGYLKKLLDPDSRREIQENIEDYRKGLIPLVVPITLIRHHLRRFDVPYLAAQVYLNPYPKELSLMNHG
jgi:uncharacterized protein YbgA (DUF1722 family)/uncharacterized protein YbbK (DUF523 family)